MVKCKECGCSCNRCAASDHDVHLHVEIENLKQTLVERESHIVTMETNFLNEANKFPNGELVALREELLTWQDKYKRLYDAHRRVQRVNQGLEDKLLKLVDVCETEKSTLTKDVATLSQKLAEANYAVKKLTEDNERYKNDVSLAIQFLQCKQSNFVAHRFDSLPQEVQVQVSSHMTSKRKPEEKKVTYEMKSIKVPIPTFPPTAMVYSVPKSPRLDRRAAESEVEAAASPQVDIVSAAIMAKVLEERQKEKAFAKHCDTCTCSKKINIVYENTHHTTGTQTGEYKKSLCLRCNENLTQTPSKMRLVKHDPASKKVQIYPNDTADTAQQNGNNIVKVQPNNFLIDETVTDSNRVVPQSNNNLLNSSVKSHPDMNFFSINEAPRVKNSKSPKLGTRLEHHYLCNETSPTYEVERNRSESDATSAKNGSSDNLKGPRYCSMRLQTGTKNILLDNAHNNVAPVLYKRHHKVKREETPTTHEISQTESYSSEELKNISVISDSSMHNQQRVAEWVQNNLENEISSSENSRSEPLLTARKTVANVEKSKYAEMEENVKRFLFGENEFLKTVEIGKLKYQNYRELEDGNCTDNNRTRSNSHTETEI